MFDRIRRARSHDESSELERLVLGASGGDQEALALLCAEISRSVLFQVTYMVGGDQSGVEDIAQEVLIRVCEKIHTLRNPKAFKGWLARIILNEKNRYLSRVSRIATVLSIDDYLETLLEDDTEGIPHEFAESEELREAMLQAVRGLPMRQREAIILHYYSGLSVTEVADAMEVTTQSVSKSLALAREKLRAELEEYRSG